MSRRKKSRTPDILTVFGAEQVPEWHVYFGTRGTAGAYIDKLLKTYRRYGGRATAFVSRAYIFPTPGVVRLFFPLTDRTEKRNVFIRGFRWVELLAAYSIILGGAMVSRPIMNVHLTQDIRLTYVFIRCLFWLGLRIRFTCHDVLGLHGDSKWRRRKLYSGADRLIVHSAYAHRILSRIMPGAEAKILRFPFPFSSFTGIFSSGTLDRVQKRMEKDAGLDYFLFIGIVRLSRGIVTLLEAWGKFRGNHRSKLVLAGKWNRRALSLKPKAAKLANCLIIDRYLSDAEFVTLIRNARFVVLPYEECYHSSVLFSCAWSHGAVITSDHPVLQEIMGDYDLEFPKNNSSALADMMERCLFFSPDRIEHYRLYLQQRIKGIQGGLDEMSGNLYDI
jgi:glycosyltransferase involved in cell wall biosynthesis